MMKSKNPQILRCALSIPCTSSIHKSIKEALSYKYSYLICPLFNNQFKRDESGLRQQNKPALKSNLNLKSETALSNYLVAKISRNYDCDSSDSSMRNNSIQGLIDEFKFISYLSLTALMIPLRNDKIANFARVLNSFLINNQILFDVLIDVPIKSCTESDNLIGKKNSSWYYWRKLRSLCNANEKLGVCLTISNEIDLDSSEVERWFAEPVKAILIPTSLFVTSLSNHPYLSKSHQNLIKKFFELHVDIIIESASCHDGIKLDTYYDYILNLFTSFKDEETYFKTLTLPYEDRLRIPLQPLMNNLKMKTYEIFEMDLVKYKKYCEAISRALVDRVNDEEKSTIETVIMVVGAGRGPLVNCALQASVLTKRKVKLYAIEKNLNAVNTLLNLKIDDWGNKVEVISSDIRNWKAPEKADIIVSELLGSFGDNELSPECLDGAQNFLKDDGISIPYQYRSFIAPIQSYKLHSEVKSCQEFDNPYEAAYAVFLHNHCRIDDEKLLFEFHHPNKSTNIDNNRFGQIDFKAKFDATLHGLAGYFDSHLYKDVFLSTTPTTHTHGLFSWFPMFFPFKNSIEIKEGETITIDFWRQVSSYKVWYEWCISSPTCSNIHNANGSTYSIGL